MMNKNSLRQLLLSCTVLMVLIFMLLYPAESLTAAREGLGIWLNTLIPTLLPFLILTDILLKTSLMEKVLSPFSRLWRFLFGLSPMGAYGLFAGILCGYPMGAKAASSLYEKGKISRREAHYLLTFSNNASPVFLTSYLAVECLNNRASVAKIAGTLLLADLCCMLFFRFVVYKNNTISSDLEKAAAHCRCEKKTPTARSLGASIDVSIMNSFETITRLGGYILLFSLITAMTAQYRTKNLFLKNIICAALEITSGLHILRKTGLPYNMQYLCSMAVTAFGGMCILMQTKSVLNNRLSARPYLSAKCLNTLITVLIILLSGS